MKIKFFYSICIAQIFFSTTFGQTDLFHEITVNKNFYSKKNITYTVSPQWKHIYNDIGWRRWSVNGQIKKQLNIWSIGGGIGAYYVFDKNIQNNLEIRPYLFLSLKSTITKNIYLNQTLKSDFRYFLFENSTNNFSTTRLRYNINIPTVLYQNKSNEVKWKIKPEIEWYILKNKNINERFINSTEYALTFLRESKKVEIGIGYRLEKFNKNLLITDPNGHTILLEINFLKKHTNFYKSEPVMYY